MTSHKFDARPSDGIDDLLRWAFRQRVGRARPSAHTWKRIYTKLERRQRFGGLLRRVLQIGTGFINHLAAFGEPQNDWVEWRAGACFSDFRIAQYGFFPMLGKPDLIR